MLLQFYLRYFHQEINYITIYLQVLHWISIVFGERGFKSDGLTYRTAKFLTCTRFRRPRYFVAKNMLTATRMKCDMRHLFISKHGISIAFAYAAFGISKRFSRDWSRRRRRRGILSKLFHRGFSLDRIPFPSHPVPVPFYETSIMTGKLCDFAFIPAE